MANEYNQGRRAMVKRDLLKQTALGEDTSPGHLPNNLTVEKIRAGNTNIRNPILVSYVAKGLLPYHGLGSGIKRALELWPRITLKDDHEGGFFTATVHRDAPISDESEPGGDHPEQLFKLIRQRPDISYDELTASLGKGRSTIMRNVNKLKSIGRIKRIGSRKTGRWEIIG